MKIPRLPIAALLFALPLIAKAQDPRLAELMKRNPEADTNKDGTLSVEEAKEFLSQNRVKTQQNSTVFIPSEAEMKAAIEGGKALAFPKTEDGSLRIAMTGHSWVEPGIRTLKPLAKAAGYAGHRQVTHTGGGSSGSANAIWLKEFGKYKDGVEAQPILIPAIATGQWDVMTMGPYPGDKLENYTQWVDFCLKHNPKMTFLVQDAWPQFLPNYDSMKPAEAVAAIKGEHEVMQGQMFAPLYGVATLKYPGKVSIIPISAALVDLMEQYAAGKIEHMTCINEAKRDGEIGFYSDGGHLSQKSGIEHLVGYGYFSMLYRRSPATVKDYVPEGVPPSFDQQMREAIWKAVVNSPFANIDDANGDGVAD